MLGIDLAARAAFAAAVLLAGTAAHAAITLTFAGDNDAAFESAGGYLDVVRGLPAASGGSHLVPLERSVGQLRQSGNRRAHHLPTPGTGLPVADGGTGVDNALTNVAPFQGNGTDFGNGEALPFSITRVGNIVTFVWGEVVQPSNARVSLEDINAIEFRIRTSGSSAANAISYSDMLFTDSSVVNQVIPGFSAAAGDVLIQLWEGIAPGDFSLTGSITQTWTTGNRPGGSALATQIKLLDIPPIPEPATWAMMIAGFGLVGAAARRRSAVAA